MAPSFTLLAAPLPPWALVSVVAALLVAGGVLLVVAVRRGGAPVERQCAGCGRVVMSDWTKCMFCGAVMEQQRAELEFISGALKGQSIGLDREVTTIGSAPGSTILISDDGVSRKHAGIRRTGDGYEVADMGSTNGLYVNGEKVARRRLEVGDVIRVGATEMVFR